MYVSIMQVKEQAERLANAGADGDIHTPANRKNLTSAQTLQMKIDAEERCVEGVYCIIVRARRMSNHPLSVNMSW